MERGNRGKARMAWDKPIKGGLVFLLPVTQPNSSAWLPVALVTIGQTCSSFENGWIAITLTHETDVLLLLLLLFSELLEGIFLTLRCPAVYWKCKITGVEELANQRRLWNLLFFFSLIACMTRCCSIGLMPGEIVYYVVLCWWRVTNESFFWPLEQQYIALFWKHEVIKYWIKLKAKRKSTTVLKQTSTQSSECYHIIISLSLSLLALPRGLGSGWVQTLWNIWFVQPQIDNCAFLKVLHAQGCVRNVFAESAITCVRVVRCSNDWWELLYPI